MQSSVSVCVCVLVCLRRLAGYLSPSPLTRKQASSSPPSFCRWLPPFSVLSQREEFCVRALWCNNVEVDRIASEHISF